jgi:hypothetical protein
MVDIEDKPEFYKVKVYFMDSTGKTCLHWHIFEEVTGEEVEDIFSCPGKTIVRSGRAFDSSAPENIIFEEKYIIQDDRQGRFDEISVTANLAAPSDK